MLPGDRCRSGRGSALWTRLQRVRVPPAALAFLGPQLCKRLAVELEPRFREADRVIADLTRAHLAALARVAELEAHPATVVNNILVDPIDLAEAILERVQVTGEWDGSIPPGEYRARPA
jgi:hypothetical protein